MKILKASIIFLLLLKLSLSQMTIFPNNYLPRDDYYLDDIANPTEVDKYIVFSYIMSTTGYKDEYSGVYYAPQTVCWSSSSFNSQSAWYSSYYSIALNASMLTNLSNTNLQGIFQKGTNLGTYGMFCAFKFYADNSSTTFYLRFKTINSNADPPPSVETTVSFLATDLSTKHDIVTITQNSNDNSEVTIRFTVSNGIINYALASENYATAYSTTTGGKIYFNNSNYAVSSLILAFTNNPLTLTLLSVSSFMLQAHVQSGVRAISGSVNNDCAFNRGCVDGTFCHPIMLACILCDAQCKSCFSDSPNACATCFPTSPDYATTYSTPGTQCTFDFVDLSQYDDFSTNVPAPYNYRVTFNFWVFIHNTRELTDPYKYPSAISLILKDFLALSFSQNDTTTDLDLYCVPLQLTFPLTSDIKDKSTFKTYISSGVQFTKITVTGASSKWTYVKCAFSYDHKQMYVNDQAPVIINFPNYYNMNNFKTFIKRFYRQGEGTSLTFQGFYFLQTQVYIRNFNVFSEYLPQTMNLKYFNIHKLPTIEDFPQLLFSLPFDDLVQDGTPPIKKAKTTLYDYSLQADTILKTSKIELTFTGQILKPPKNFKRISLLTPNFKYSDVDLSVTGALALTCGGNRINCFDDFKGYACNAIGYHLNPADFSCSTSCPNGYTRLPNVKNVLSSYICNYACPTGATSCPKLNAELLDIKTNFACGVGYYNAFYKCYSTSTFSKYSSIQFSGVLKTRSILIDLLTTSTNFIIDMWVHPDLLFQQVPPLINSHIMLTENHQIYYDVNSGKYTLKVKDSTGGLKTLQIDDGIYYYGWNHIILGNLLTNGGSQTKIQISFSNNFYNKNSLVTTIDGTIPTRYICFCNMDTGASCCSMTTSVTWMDVWISSLKIWDGDYATVWSALDYEKYANTSPAFLLNYFPFTIDNIKGDEVPDILNPGTIKAVVPFNSISPSINPDYDNSFNYGWNFSFNDQNAGKYAFSVTKSSSMATVIKSFDCDVSCSMCYGNMYNQCLACNTGYALVGNMCKSSGANNSGSGYYYFLNPTSSPPIKLSLNISTLNLSTYPAITIFFFLKIYGFTTSAANNQIILFDSVNHFDLFYDPATQAVSLEYNSVLQFTFANYQENYFGTWVPMSIALFRSPDTSLQPNMSQMTIYDKLLPKLDLGNPGYTVTEISFPSGFIGMVAEITLYSSFVINAWGIAQHPNSASLLTASPIIYKFAMKSASTGANCLTSSELSPQTAAGVGLSCVPDYIPHLDQSCLDSQLVSLDEDNQRLPKCSSGICQCTSQCIGSMSKCDWTVSTCNNKTPEFVNYLLYKYIDKSNNSYIVCGNHNGMDLARYNKGVISNISSPSYTFKMEFWFFTRSYLSNQFGSLEVIWDRHVKIVVSRNGPTIASTCFAIPDVAIPANDGTLLTVSHGTTTAVWYYVVCGVDTSKKKFYVSSGRTTTLKETIYSEINVIGITSNLTIEEKSPVNYGVTYLRELRLWSCYNCNSQMAYVTYFKENLRFQNVLHYFDFLDPAGVLSDMQSGAANPNRKVTFVTKTSFWGYNILPEAVPPPNCVEDGFNYFNQNTNLGCDRMYNMNILDNVTFNNVPIVRSNRWTLEFWIYVEGADDFTTGVNVIFENHMSISVQADSTSATALTAFCFPQGYRDKIKDLYGTDVVKKYNGALNKSKDVLSGMFSNWVFLKCAFDLDREIFYFNNFAEQSIQKENFYYNSSSNSMISNIAPLKYFIPDSKYTNLIVQGALLNKTRIFMRTLNLYREYIPATMDFRYRQMKLFVNLNYWPIILSVDFNDYDPTYRGLLYYYNDFEDGKASSSYIYTYLQNIDSKDYGTYPVYEILTFCNEKQKLVGGVCVDISSMSTCDKSSVFCLDDNKYFWCPSGSYLSQVSLLCGSDCPNYSTRLPETPDNMGICGLTNSNFKYAIYPSASAKMLKSEYKKLVNFSCQSGYTRTNYKCYLNTLISSSFLYFSNSFNMLNTLANFSSSKINEYFVEAWIMIDNFFPLSYDQSVYTYLVAHPHKIVRSSSDKKFKYTNSYLTGNNTLYDLPSFSLYEWNRIIIKNYLNSSTVNNVFVNSWVVDVYVNNNFTMPDASVTMNRGFDMSLAGFAFCNVVEFCKLGTVANSIQVVAKWGSAFYKNLRVWDYYSSNLYTIIYSDSSNLNDFTDNILAYYKLSIDTIMGSKVTSVINSPDFDFNVASIFSNNLDDDIRLNYAGNFDIGEANNNTFVTSISPAYNATYVNNDNDYNKGANVTVANCDSACSRCFSAKVNDCYACKDNKILIGRKCYDPTNYYFKVPSNNYLVNNITLSSKNEAANTYLNQINPFTITFYMKFMGVNMKSSSYSTKLHFPILCFFDELNFIGWNNKIKQFEVVYNANSVIFTYAKSYDTVGRWTHFGLSVYKNNATNLVFPNMINFMIDKLILAPVKGFDIQKTVINLNVLSLTNYIVAYFSKLRVYSNFYFGTYGSEQAQGIKSTLSDLFLEFPLQSTDNTNSTCLTDKETLAGAQAIGVICASDYNENDDSAIQCDSKKTTKSVEILSKSTGIATNDCINCNKTYCNSFCFGAEAKQCTCQINSENYWIRSETVTNSDNSTQQIYYCEKPDSLNIAYYQPITVKDIKVGTSEYKMEVWVYINTYSSSSLTANNNFPGMNIIWNYFTRIELLPDLANKLKVNCYPYSNFNDLSSYKFFVSDSALLANWAFIRCSVSVPLLQMSINSNPKQDIKTSIPKNLASTTTLLITDNSETQSYGIALVRELRLWSGSNYLFYDTSRINLNIDSYSSLLHYFKNYFPEDSARVNSMYDVKNGVDTKLARTKEYIQGYNYITGYTNLILCEEGQVFNTKTNQCEKYTLSDFYSSMNSSSTYTSEELLVRSKSVYQLAIDIHLEGLYQNKSIIFPDPNNRPNLTLVDPPCDSKMCNSHGFCMLIDQYTTCYCLGGYLGTNCHLQNDNYTALDNIYNLFWNKTLNTLSTYGVDSNVLQSMSYIIRGSAKFMSESTLLDVIVNKLNNFLVTSNALILKVINDDLLLNQFLTLIDNCYTSNIIRMNMSKAKLMKQLYPAGFSPRNVALNYIQKIDYAKSFLSSRNLLEIYGVFLMTNSTSIKDNYFNFLSDNFDVDLFKIDQNFNFTAFFNTKLSNSNNTINNYRPFFEMKKCLDSLGQYSSYWASFITWFNNPYMYDEDLSWNYTSPMLSIKLYSADGKQILVGKCDENPISFYMTVFNPEIVDITNTKRNLLLKGNIYAPTDPIFTQPFYIEPSGLIQNTTRQERIDKYYMPIQVNFNYFDAAAKTFSSDGMNFYNYSDVYMICNATHLTDFMMKYSVNPSVGPEDSRLYYLNYPQIFLNFTNYLTNYGFFLSLANLFLYLTLMLVLFLIERSYVKKHGLRPTVETELMRFVYPYGNLEEEIVIKNNKEIVGGPDIDSVENNNELNRLKKSTLDRNSEDPIIDHTDLGNNAPHPYNDLEFNNDNENGNGNEDRGNSKKNSNAKSNNTNNKEKDNNTIENNEEENEQGNKDLEIAPDVQRKRRNNLMFAGKPRNEIDAYASEDILVLKQNYPQDKNNLKTKKSKSLNNLSEINDNIDDNEDNNEKNFGNKYRKNNNFLDNFDRKDGINSNSHEGLEKPTNSQFREFKVHRRILDQRLEVYNSTVRYNNLRAMNLSCCGFLFRNIRNRHILITTVLDVSQLYPASIRILYLAFYFTCELLLTSLVYLFNADLIYPDIIYNPIPFIGYAIATAAVTNFMIYLMSLIFSVSVGKIRLLLHKLKYQGQKFDQDWAATTRNLKIKTIVLSIIFALMWLVTLFFAFGVCAVYVNQSFALLITYMVSILLDVFVLSFLVELLISMMYCCRRNRACLPTLDTFNRLKSFKTLSA